MAFVRKKTKNNIRHKLVQINRKNIKSQKLKNNTKLIKTGVTVPGFLFGRGDRVMQLKYV